MQQQMSQAADPMPDAARLLAWGEDCIWAAEALYDRFGIIVPLDAFATSGDPNEPRRYLLAAVPVTGGVAMVRCYPSQEEVKVEGVCPCGHVYESHDLKGVGTATPRLQLERVVRHWRAIGNKCALCEWGALEEAEG